MIAQDTRGRALEKPLFARRIGLTGKPDYLLDVRGNTIPVEVKPRRRAPRPYESDLMQLAAYCLLVEETIGTAPPYGLLRYAERTAPRLPARIYLDVGTAEGEEAVADARALREILTRPGFARCSELSWVEEEGAGHDEAAWGRRFREAMPFLLGRSE